MSSMRGLSASSRAISTCAGLAVVALAAATTSGEPIETIFTKVAAAPTSQVPGALDLNGAAVFSEFTAFESIVLNPGGSSWMLKGRTSLGSDLEHVAVMGSARSGSMFVQEGMTAPGGLAAERFDFLGSTASNLNPFGRFDSSNNFAFAARARNGPNGSTAAANGQRIFLWNGTGFSVVMKQGDAYAGLFDSAAQPGGGAPGNEIAGNAIGTAHLLDNGDVGFMDNAIGGIGFTLRPASFYHSASTGVNTMYHQTGGTDTVTDIAGTGTNTFALSTGLVMDRFVTTPDGAHAMFIGSTAGPTNRSSLIRDNRVIITNGTPAVPGIPVAGSMTNFELLSDGHWTAWGLFRDQAGFWAVKDGYLIAKSGDLITPSGTERWGNSIRFVTANRNGDSIVVGGTDAGTASNEVAVLNGVSVLVRKGDMVDANNNNLNDDDVFVGRASLSADVIKAGAASDDNYFYMIPGIRNGAGADINCTNCFAFDPNAFLRIRFAGSCSRADFDHSGALDFFDYLDFVDAFSVSSLLADFNADGEIDFFDYLDYVDAFSVGC